MIDTQHLNLFSNASDQQKLEAYFYHPSTVVKALGAYYHYPDFYLSTHLKTYLPIPSSLNLEATYTKTTFHPFGITWEKSSSTCHSIKPIFNPLKT